MITLKFWAQPCSHADAQLLTQLMRLGSNYYSRLAQIENDYRDAIRTWRREHPATQDLWGKEDVTFKEILAAINSYMRPNREDYMRAQVWEAKRTARHASGLSPGAWGTYQRVEEAHEDSRSTTDWSDNLTPFRPADEGEVAVHVQQRTVTIADLFTDRWSFAQLGSECYSLGHRVNGYASASASETDCGRSGQPGAKRMHELKIRVGSDNRQPIWARLHMLVPTRGDCRGRYRKCGHADIPAGEVRWVRVHRLRRGIRYVWSVQIVMQPEKARVSPAPTASTVAIDLRCGRRVEGGRLLAYAVGSDGRHHQLLMEDLHVEQRNTRTVCRGVVADRDKAAELASIRQTRLNELVARVREAAGPLPEDHWLREWLTRAQQWRRWGHVVRLYRELVLKPIDGWGPLCLQLEQELKQDRHLLAWQVHSEQKRIRRITGRVHEWCARLATEYATVAIEDIELRTLREVKPRKGPKTADERAEDRRRRITARGIQMMAPGRFRLLQKRHVETRARTLVVVKAAGTSAECCQCATPLDVTAVDLVACNSCGQSSPPWVNASMNILRRAMAGDIKEGKLPAKKRQRMNRRRASSTETS